LITNYRRERTRKTLYSLPICCAGGEVGKEWAREEDGAVDLLWWVGGKKLWEARGTRGGGVLSYKTGKISLRRPLPVCINPRALHRGDLGGEGRGSSVTSKGPSRSRWEGRSLKRKKLGEFNPLFLCHLAKRKCNARRR